LGGTRWFGGLRRHLLAWREKTTDCRHRQDKRRKADPCGQQRAPTPSALAANGNALPSSRIGYGKRRGRPGQKAWWKRDGLGVDPI